jgi:hypothetical protein
MNSGDSAILAKLGFALRGQIATWVARPAVPATAEKGHAVLDSLTRYFKDRLALSSLG